MAGQIVAFSRLLKEAGLHPHPRAVVDACRAVDVVGVDDRERMYWALRANLVADRERFDAFDRLYRLFWDEGVDRLPPRETARLGAVPVYAPAPAPPSPGAAAGPPGVDAAGGTTPDEILVRRDLRDLAPDEDARLREILLALLARLTTRPGRRHRPTLHGRGLAMRRLLRENTRYGGDILRLVHREKKITRRRIALLGDVSGSMNPYNRFFLLLAHALGRHDPDAEVYAFSTRLFRLTEFLRERDAVRAVERVMEQTSGWSGGTRIGECLASFNRALERRGRLRGAVVVIFSDGWERGDPAVLRREVIRLRSAAARLYWLNPLKGDPDYRPLCRGMAAALPYLDGFYPAHNVESFSRFARQVTRARR